MIDYKDQEEILQGLLKHTYSTSSVIFLSGPGGGVKDYYFQNMENDRFEFYLYLYCGK